ncbi:Capsanthin/capsorubin synthase, chromoplastic [Dirofilaria immitis]
MTIASSCNRENSLIILSSIIALALLSNVASQSTRVKSSKQKFQSCKATCSPHITLPCDFGSLDRCIMKSCRNACWKDDRRKVQSCFCRGSNEGPTLRACFCGPSKIRRNSKPKGKLFFV